MKCEKDLEMRRSWVHSEQDGQVRTAVKTRQQNIEVSNKMSPSIAENSDDRKLLDLLDQVFFFYSIF